MSCLIASVWIGGLFLFVEALLPHPFMIGLQVAAASNLPETICGRQGAGTPAPAASLVLVGDVMPARNLSPYSEYDPRPLDWNFLFDQAKPYIADADIAFCNLESPISGRGKRVGKEFSFNAPPEAAKALRDLGFDVVSLANNHCLDFGPEALADTRANLDANGVMYAGIAEAKAAQRPAIIERGGVKVAFLGYITANVSPGEFNSQHPGPARAIEEGIAADIAKVRNDVDIVVVSLHWGMDYTTSPSAEQRAFGRALIDAGADIIAGHHPHVQQDPEFYHGGLIIYSMGNFVFATYSKPPARKTRLYRVRVTRKGIESADYLPFEIAEGTGQVAPVSKAFVPLTRPGGLEPRRTPARRVAEPMETLLAAGRSLDLFLSECLCKSQETTDDRTTN